MNKPITLCDRCDIAASCLLNYDGVPCRKNRTVEPTKADRLRAMTDEELAKYLSQITDKHEFHTTIEAWLDWLKLEATDADN